MKICWLSKKTSTPFLKATLFVCSGALSTLGLTACSNAGVSQPVSVTSAPLAVHTSYFKDSNSRDFRSLDESVTKDPNYDAFTIWFYHCFAGFQTEDEHIDDTVGASSVRLKIKGVQVRLSCPVTVWLAQDSTALVREHEKGHVYICRKIYDRAPAVARQAASAVVGKSYDGMGSTIAEARRMAINQAEGDIALTFREKIVDLADEISTLYDKFCSEEISQDSPKATATLESKRPQQALADQACQQVLGRAVKFL
ncbi:hypothetical protein KBI23_08975 [bacterium]|nr:hypothetical protein [bacterium]MBP9809248.1 hypothetical protein [bacterium]